MISLIFRALHQMVRNGAGLKGALIRKNVTILVAWLAASPGMAIASSDECRLSVLGDSLTAGYGVEEDQAFPAQLQQRLEMKGIDCEVINAGVSGDTSAGGAARIGWVLADNPTHLLIELGGNDALRALPAEQLRTNLNTIIDKARSEGAQVMLAGMLAPPNLGPRYGEEFASVYSGLADEYDLVFYPFFLENVAAIPELLIEDGIHPNPSGVAVIVDGIFPFIETFLAQE